MIIFSVYTWDPNKEIIILEKEFNEEIVCEKELQETILFLQRSGFVGMGKCEKITAPII